MSNGFLSQEEIDSLLNGGSVDSEPEDANDGIEEEILSDIEKDLLGEVGNISMGSASTALSTILGQKVNITTPVVSVTTLSAMREDFEVPNIALDVKYTSGISGSNLLVMKVMDAAVIANLMMGGDGRIEKVLELSEIEESAVSEAMNQMIGSAATSMATMFAREVNISPPNAKIWSAPTDEFSESIGEHEPIVEVLFKMTIGDLVDSSIMQILPIQTAKKIVSIMMGTESQEEAKPASTPKQEVQNNSTANHNTAPQNHNAPTPSYNEPVQRPSSPQPSYNNESYGNTIVEKPIETQPQVNVKQASFQNLDVAATRTQPQNIDLILDVPLEISVVLGRAKKSIKEILEMGNGSLIELDKLAEEPVEILVNGKKVAYGEVVVVDENFGVRITNIVSSEERVKSLGR